ncbi:Hypothetical protein AKI40_1370 [Enterobacter sp. FY-07]|nr:Hypothetical protein AKI40_1370 [Enterobacter sp. FY-07]
MFLRLNACGDFLFCIAIEHRHFCLQNHRAAVQLIGDKVHGGAMLFIAIFQYLTVRVQTGIFRQQGRVDIQQTPGVVGDKCRTEDTHITRQHHQIRRISVDFQHQFAIESIATGELVCCEGMCGNCCFPRTFKAERIGLITEYRPQGAVDFLLFAGVDNCLQIASVTGNQHHDIFHSMTTRSLESDALMIPIFHAFSPLAFSSAMALSASAAGSAITIPTPQLKVRYISWRLTLPALCNQLNTAGHCQDDSSMTAWVLSGSTRGMFSQKPPPVRCAMACTSTLAISSNTDFT